jgi:hypothetical protein
MPHQEPELTTCKLEIKQSRCQNVRKGPFQRFAHDRVIVRLHNIGNQITVKKVDIETTAGSSKVTEREREVNNNKLPYPVKLDSAGSPQLSDL